MQGSLLSGEHISKIFATLPETFGHQPRNPAGRFDLCYGIYDGCAAQFQSLPAI